MFSIRSFEWTTASIFLMSKIINLIRYSLPPPLSRSLSLSLACMCMYMCAWSCMLQLFIYYTYDIIRQNATRQDSYNISFWTQHSRMHTSTHILKQAAKSPFAQPDILFRGKMSGLHSFLNFIIKQFIIIDEASWMKYLCIRFSPQIFYLEFVILSSSALSHTAKAHTWVIFLHQQPKHPLQLATLPIMASCL